MKSIYVPKNKYISFMKKDDIKLGYVNYFHYLCNRQSGRKGSAKSAETTCPTLTTKHKFQLLWTIL